MERLGVFQARTAVSAPVLLSRHAASVEVSVNGNGLMFPQLKKWRKK